MYQVQWVAGSKDKDGFVHTGRGYVIVKDGVMADSIVYGFRDEALRRRDVLNASLSSEISAPDMRKALDRIERVVNGQDEIAPEVLLATVRDIVEKVKEQTSE